MADQDSEHGVVWTAAPWRLDLVRVRRHAALGVSVAVTVYGMFTLELAPWRIVAASVVLAAGVMGGALLGWEQSARACYRTQRVDSFPYLLAVMGCMPAVLIVAR